MKRKQDLKEKFSVNVIDTDLHIMEPQDILLGYLKETNHSSLTAGKLKDFKLRLVGIIGLLFFLHFSSIYSGMKLFIVLLISLIPIYIAVECVIYLVSKLNDFIDEYGLIGIFGYFTIATIIIFVTSTLLLL